VGVDEHLSLDQAGSPGASDTPAPAAPERDRSLAEHAQGGLATLSSTCALNLIIRLQHSWPVVDGLDLTMS
tara:strand:- start:904 stop:1116 length:213 start_codon:yes stop_codon:yes gene_type:complete